MKHVRAVVAAVLAALLCVGGGGCSGGLSEIVEVGELAADTIALGCLVAIEVQASLAPDTIPVAKVEEAKQAYALYSTSTIATEKLAALVTLQEIKATYCPFRGQNKQVVATHQIKIPHYLMRQVLEQKASHAEREARE